MAFKTVYKRANRFRERDDDTDSHISTSDDSLNTCLRESGFDNETLTNERPAGATCNSRWSPSTSGNYSDFLGEKYEYLQDFESDSNSDNDEDMDKDGGEEDDIGAVFEETREIYRHELSQTLPDYLKPVSKEVGIQDIKTAIDEIPKPEDDNTNQLENKSCAHCCSRRRVENVLSFKKGQHIRLPGYFLTFSFGRELRSVYNHHAIIKEVNTTCGHKVEMILIHFTKVNKDINIHETTEIFNLENDEIYIIDYLHPRYRPDEIVRRAESMLPKNTRADRQRRFRSYNVFTRNCEHFATWCVVGTDESFQAKSVRKVAAKIVTKTSGVGCKTARFMKRFLRTSAGKIAARFNAVVHLPGFVLGFTAIVYLIYCIVMTIKHHVQYKKGELCKSCFKREVVTLWTHFGAFVATSGISYILVYFLLPLIAPNPVGIPLLLVIILLSVVLQWTVAKVRKVLMSPYDCEKIPVERLSDLNIGSMISFSYFGIPHNAIVTEVHEDNDESTVGALRCVHYGLRSWNIFRARKVMEEFIKVNLNKKSKQLKLVDCKHLNKFQGEQVVKRARERVGERKWNAVSNRSDHLCFWALVNNENDLETENSNHDNIGETQTKHKSSLCIDKKEVHIREDVRMGDVVNYNKTSGIVVYLDDISQCGEQEFEMEMIVYQNYRAKRIKKTVNLKKKRLFVNRYHPAHCCSMNTRVQRAIEKENKKCDYWTEEGFFESCILKDDSE